MSHPSKLMAFAVLALTLQMFGIAAMLLLVLMWLRRYYPTRREVVDEPATPVER